jgi:hypothetical protein
MATKHIDDFHWQINARGGGVQADANVRRAYAVIARNRIQEMQK